MCHSILEVTECLLRVGSYEDESQVVEAVPETLLRTIEFHLKRVVGDCGFNNIIIQSEFEERNGGARVVRYKISRTCLETLSNIGFTTSEDVMYGHFIVVESDFRFHVECR